MVVVAGPEILEAIRSGVRSERGGAGGGDGRGGEELAVAGGEEGRG